MTRKITFGFLFLLLNFSAFAQTNIGHLTIFSEDGDKFFLILNGERQNDIAQTNLRVEDLNQPYYNAKIIFEDKSLMDISKNNLSLTDADDIFCDVTYKIKRDKNNKSKMKMNFFSMIPVEKHYVAPSNVYVMHYGQPQPPVVVNVAQTTTTTTTAGTNMSVGMNTGGVNIGMNVNINEPVMTTQATTTTNGSFDNHAGHDHHDNDRGCNRKYSMLPADFNSALATVKNQKFDDTRLKTAKQITSANCLNAGQIVKIAEVFGFEESKLDFAKFAYDHCTEKENYFKINNIFSFSTSVDDLTEYIQSRN